MNPANPLQWVEEYEAKPGDLKKKADDLAKNLAASTATVSSKDKAVTGVATPRTAAAEPSTGAISNRQWPPGRTSTSCTVAASPAAPTSD